MSCQRTPENPRQVYGILKLNRFSNRVRIVKKDYVRKNLLPLFLEVANENVALPVEFEVKPDEEDDGFDH